MACCHVPCRDVGPFLLSSEDVQGAAPCRGSSWPLLNESVFPALLPRSLPSPVSPLGLRAWPLSPRRLSEASWQPRPSPMSGLSGPVLSRILRTLGLMHAHTHTHTHTHTHAALLHPAYPWPDARAHRGTHARTHTHTHTHTHTRLLSRILRTLDSHTHTHAHTVVCSASPSRLFVR